MGFMAQGCTCYSLFGLVLLPLILGVNPGMQLITIDQRLLVVGSLAVVVVVAAAVVVVVVGVAWASSAAQHAVSFTRRALQVFESRRPNSALWTSSSLQYAVEQWGAN